MNLTQHIQICAKTVCEPKRTTLNDDVNTNRTHFGTTNEDTMTAKEYARNEDLIYMETSAVTGEGVYQVNKQVARASESCDHEFNVALRKNYRNIFPLISPKKLPIL